MPLPAVGFVLGAAALCNGCSDESADTMGPSDGGALTSREGGATMPDGRPVEPVDNPEGGSAASPVVGSFTVDLVAPTSSQSEGRTTVIGKVFDGPTPAQTIWRETGRDGDCVLLEPDQPYCDMPCGGSAACVGEDQCQAYPTARSAGTVTLSGVRTTDGQTMFSMEPIANGYQPTGGIQLPLASFSEDDPITIEATGGDFSPFSISARGILPLDLLSTNIRVDPDTPIELRWTAATVPNISEIFVRLDISHHGGVKGVIECTTPDDGSLSIAASLTTELLNLGVAGFPTIAVARTSVGSTTIEPGRVELVIRSRVERGVEIEGLTSCNATEACPPGQTCGADLRCQ